MNSEEGESMKMLNASLNVDYDANMDSPQNYPSPIEITPDTPETLMANAHTNASRDNHLNADQHAVPDVVSQTQYPAPPEEIIYAHVNYPVLPEEQNTQLSPRRQEVNIDDQGVQESPVQLELPFLLKKHPLFRKSNMLTYSHFAIISLFVYNLYTFSKTGKHESLLPAVYLEFGLALAHYLLRLIYRGRLVRTDEAFIHHEVYPEIIRLVCFILLVILQVGPGTPAVDFIHKHIMSVKTVVYTFLVLYIMGCLARFNFMHSLFNPSMSNLASSILVGMWVKFTYMPNTDRFSGFESYPALYWIAMIFGYFTLFIAGVKCLSTLMHAVYSLAACKFTSDNWKFFVMSNLWGIDYLLFSSFVIAACMLMKNEWIAQTGLNRSVLKYSGYGYMGFYPVYSLLNIFLPYFMSSGELQALRTFEEMEIQDQVRDNIREKRRGNTVRVVTNKNSAEKMITLFQVSPFFFSEKASNASSKQKFNFQSEAEIAECLICFNSQPECLIMPCMHGGVCVKCSKDILKRSKNCPFCRAKINTIKVIEERGDNKYLVKETISLM